MVMAENKCEICKERISKYKCPVCSVKFCCVACFKSHKASRQCVKPVNEESESKNGNDTETKYEFETEDTVQPEKLRLLGLDRKLVRSLENPHLRKMLKHLDSTENHAEEMEQAMKEPVFVEFVEHCLRVVEGGSDDESDDSS